MLTRPLEWSGRTLGRFMRFFGPISSVFDIITYAYLFFVLCPAVCGGNFASLAEGGQLRFIAVFQTGWFLESMWTQVLILHLLRTQKVPMLQSRPSPSGDGCHDAGNFIFHHPDLYASGNVDWFDRFATELFWLFGRDRFTLSVVCYISKRQIS